MRPVLLPGAFFLRWDRLALRGLAGLDFGYAHAF
jgi:hypothetical protein